MATVINPATRKKLSQSLSNPAPIAQGMPESLPPPPIALPPRPDIPTQGHIVNDVVPSRPIAIPDPPIQGQGQGQIVNDVAPPTQGQGVQGINKDGSLFSSGPGNNITPPPVVRDPNTGQVLNSSVKDPRRPKGLGQRVQNSQSVVDRLLAQRRQGNQTGQLGVGRRARLNQRIANARARVQEMLQRQRQGRRFQRRLQRERQAPVQEHFNPNPQGRVQEHFNPNIQ